MRVGCLFIPHFMVSLERLDRPDLRDRAVIIGGAPEDRQVVWDCSAEAEATGVHPGMQLRLALSRCRDATFIEPRPTVYEDHFEDLLRRLERVGPFVEPGEAHGNGLPGLAYVNLSGVGAGPNAAYELGLKLAAAVPPGLKAGIGLAPGKFSARLAAIDSDGAPRIVEGSDLVGFLAPFPASLLPVPGAMQRRLQLYGIKTLADLAMLPQGAVQAQFGAEGLKAWRLANGEDDEPVNGRRREEAVVRRLSFPSPTASIDSLLIAIRQMLASTFALPAMRNKGVRRLRVRARISGARSWERTLTLKEPSSDTGHIFFALKSLLGNLVLPGPIEEVTLRLTDFCGETGKQSGMFSGNSGRELQLHESVRQLKARFGRTPIFRLVEVEPWSRIPERRRALIDYDP
ncbi:MAG: DNA polymerase Y family protein [Dehalococcoidia bacterium]|nr:DNA polymerase Y family protein [Dehalococcoidia bacterium]